MIRLIQSAKETRFILNEKTVMTVPAREGCTDLFEPIGDGFWRWTRSSDTPVSEMKLALRARYVPAYFQVPSVNYNGNGWGSGAQYYGFRCDDGTPWSYAWHRVAIPDCTYTENDGGAAVALFGEEKGGMEVFLSRENYALFSNNI